MKFPLTGVVVGVGVGVAVGVGVGVEVGVVAGVVGDEDPEGLCRLSLLEIILCFHPGIPGTMGSSGFPFR